MFCRSDIQACKKRRKPAGKAAGRKKKPYNLKARRPHEIIEFDMKQINLPGKTLYALCAIDQYTRRPVVHVSSSCSSAAGKTALQKIRQRFTKDIIIINDNGSENMGKAEQWLKEE